MRFRQTLGLFALALLVMAPVVARASSHELELDYVWYFPSNVELEGLNTEIEYQDTSGWGARYGYRFDAPWGIGITWSHVDMDSANSDNTRGCSHCDFDVDFADFSAEWYPGNHEWALYGGLGWASGQFSVNFPGGGTGNDETISDDAITYHIGTAYAWRIGHSFYIRPDARLRFIQLDQSGRGKYDSEDPEIRVGFGWRF